jgi:tRNA(Ile)-lysidine synthase
MDSPWDRRADSLATLIPRERLHPAVLEWASGRGRAGRWAVALSGGADSVCLLVLLSRLRPGRLVALHFNHRLRGAASDADERFCRRLCRALDVPFVRGAWASAARRPGEAAAREARFAFLEGAMNARRLRVLVLGHQQDDVAETMLMRLSRGSGTAGLAAPRPVQRAGKSWRLRPLLGLKKAEIASALRRAGIAWREDASNMGDAHFRNRIRHSVLSRWIRASGRDALAGAALSRELLEEDDQALEQAAGKACRITRAGRLDLGRMEGQPRAVVRRCLHRWLLSHGLEGILSRKGFEELLLDVATGRRTRKSLGAGGFAVIRGGWLAYARPAGGRRVS